MGCAEFAETVNKSVKRRSAPADIPEVVFQA
jgi:hypothetical protein